VTTKISSRFNNIFQGNQIIDYFQNKKSGS
jgi:hypothetical protein